MKLHKTKAYQSSHRRSLSIGQRARHCAPMAPKLLAIVPCCFSIQDKQSFANKTRPFSSNRCCLKQSLANNHGVFAPPSSGKAQLDGSPETPLVREHGRMRPHAAGGAIEKFHEYSAQNLTSKLTNALMKGGKKDVAEKIVRRACAL